jgi:hypothetical protein
MIIANDLVAMRGNWQMCVIYFQQLHKPVVFCWAEVKETKNT